MEINKQLFEDVLSGKLKGKFVLRNGCKCNSDELYRTKNNLFLYRLNSNSYTQTGNYYMREIKSYIDIIDFIPDTNMKENELKIEIPDNKVIDWDESKKQNKIVLKDKQLTYDDIIKNAGVDYISNVHYFSDNQIKCLLAKNRLANVAIYLNNGWKPDFSDALRVFVIYNESETNTIGIDNENSLYAKDMGHIIFKSIELAQQAIDILGEETVKLALEPLGI